MIGLDFKSSLVILSIDARSLLAVVSHYRTGGGIVIRVPTLKFIPLSSLFSLSHDSSPFPVSICVIIPEVLRRRVL